jgi:hypothetical protein
MKPFFNALATLIALLPLDSKATTVTLYWDTERIVIGSDSKIRFSGKSSEICKIIESNGVFFVIDGVRSNSSVKFDAYAIAERSLSPTGSPLPLAEKVRAFERAMVDPLIRVIEWSKINDPIMYSGWLRTDPPVQAAFATVENGKLALITTRFQVDAQGKLEPPFHYFQTDRFPTGFVPRGAFERSYRESWVEFLHQFGPVEATRRFIQRQITKSPELVGPPIAVVEITRKGTIWRSAGSCATSPQSDRSPN